MDNTKELLIQKIESLPKAYKSYILSKEWVKNLSETFLGFTFDEWQITSIENEVFIVLVGLEPYTNLSENISKEAEIDIETANKIAVGIINKILGPITEKFRKDFGIPEETKQPEKTNSIGKSFEETILNQARGMMPARHASQSDAGGPARTANEDTSYELRDGANKKTEENNKPNVPLPNYSGGNDPYREPIQ